MFQQIAVMSISNIHFCIWFRSTRTIVKHNLLSRRHNASFCTTSRTGFPRPMFPLQCERMIASLAINAFSLSLCVFSIFHVSTKCTDKEGASLFMSPPLEKKLLTIYIYTVRMCPCRCTELLLCCGVYMYIYVYIIFSGFVVVCCDMTEAPKPQTIELW